MPSALEKAEADLAKALAKLAPLDAALDEAHRRQLANYHADRDAVLKAIAKRDPVRIKVMDAQDRVAELNGGPPTIGKANRG